MRQTARERPSRPDTEQFRLRRFVELLIEQDQVHIHDEPVPLTNMAAHLDGNEKAVLFRKAGPEGAEVVGNLLGNRARIGLAFGMDRSRRILVSQQNTKEKIRTNGRPSGGCP